MNALGFISFLVLSMHWPKLMQCWQSVESLPIFRNCAYKTTYMRRIRLTASIVLVFALGISLRQYFLNQNKMVFNKTHFLIFLAEHLLSITAAIHFIFIKNHVSNFTRTLLSSLVPQSHSLPMGIAIIICFINECATFIWNYIDIFIMMMSIGLSTHFKLFNIELKQAKIEVRNNFYIHCKQTIV